MKHERHDFQQEGTERMVRRRVLKYILSKAALILITIFIGVFITVLIINRPLKRTFGTSEPQLDAQVRRNIETSLRYYQYDHPSIFTMSSEYRQELINNIREDLVNESGLNKPYLIKNLIWTFNALRLDWGDLVFEPPKPVTLFATNSKVFNSKALVAEYLPATLLLAGSAYLLIFLIGLPVALFLSQNFNKWYDKLLVFIAPISSVPSWVIGILLIVIFAVELRWFPSFGIVDPLPPKTMWGYVPIVLKHMVLPVTAIFLSLFFQLVYSWRTIFVTFGEEDYVDLGKATGVKPGKLRKNYILLPTLPYVITSFTLMLISFWQMAMAIEVVFKWPGMGWLYVNVGLPNFFGESMYPGELIIALNLVVLFAYLLGIVIFVLDVIYVIVDPRIRLQNKVLNFRTLRSKHRRSQEFSSESLRTGKLNKPPPPLLTGKHKDKITFAMRCSVIRENLRKISKKIANFFNEVKRFPSAVVGFVIILILISGSIYAVVALPYQEIGEQWTGSVLPKRITMPRLAMPAWTNLFRKGDYLSTIYLSTREGEATRTEQDLSSSGKLITYTFEVDYNYEDFPSDLILYFNAIYDQKKPFITLSFLTPDGREYIFGGMAIIPESYYDFERNIPIRKLVNENPNLKAWFDLESSFPTPNYYIVFANPEKNLPEVVKGTYTITINGITFEDESDLNAELVLLGHVYGFAGTDHMRRDLIVPLLWGLPFALIIGLGGSLITTILSMILAATGVWFGGWVDDLLQRLTEVNLILPVIAICVLAVAYLGINMWVILFIIVLLSVFGSPLKSFRSALLQIRDAPYIEAARSYGAGSFRIIFKYMLPRIIPVLVPQLIILIPSFVFLEATLGLFNISSYLPTWGRIIYEGLRKGALFGSRFWVLEPIALLLLTGVAFALFGSALERILNPRLQDD